MRITSFWAKGYRSLRDVRLEGLGPFNVFYGPNGGGKSNVLEAIRTLHKLAGLLLAWRPVGIVGAHNAWSPQSSLHEHHRASAGSAARERGIIKAADPTAYQSTGPITLGGEWEIDDSFGLAKVLQIKGLRAAVVYAEPLAGIGESLGFSFIATHSGDSEWKPFSPDPQTPARSDALDMRAQILGELLANRAFDLIGAIREMHPAVEPTELPKDTDLIRWNLDNGRVPVALFLAATSPKREIRQGLTKLRSLLEGPPLRRKSFDAVQDPQTKAIDVREPLERGGDVSLDMAGLGIAQIYSVLSRVILSRARMVAIEEPEAHLHGPSSGLQLRELLIRAVKEGHIDQLFIATHSILFDLDDTGFFEVRQEDGETVVQKKPLDEIYVHLFDPGPTLQALEELLRYGLDDKVMYSRADGTGVTAKELWELLRKDDPEALVYLRQLHGAAVDVTGLRARRKDPH